MMATLHNFGIVLCTIFLTTYANEVGQPVKVLEVNGCALKYNKDVHDKPDIFFTTTNIPGICRLQKHQQESTENYELFKIEYYRKENEYQYGNWEKGPIIPGTIQKMNNTLYQALVYDVRTKSFMYIEKPLKRDREILVRKRFNDSRIIQKISSRDLFQNSALRGEGINDLAYDWRTKNLFVINRAGIAVMNLEKPWTPVDLVMGTYLGLAIHPNAGYLYFVEWARTDKHYKEIISNYGWVENPYKGDYTSRIYRTHLDGSNKREIGPSIRDRDAFITNLVIDFHTDRLYWSIPHMNVIQSSNLDGTEIKDVIHRELFVGLTEDAPRSISFDKNYVYYLLNNRTVRRLDKQTLKEDEDFEIVNEGTGLIAEMVVYDPESYKITIDHPCLINNGGCEQYCLVSPRDHTKVGQSRTCLSSNKRN